MGEKETTTTTVAAVGAQATPATSTAENVAVTNGNNVQTGTGTAGLETQQAGATTVSNAAAATGGIEPGNYIIPDIDAQLFRFQTDETPLMDIMLKSKPVPVKSPIVEHPLLDEEKPSVRVVTAMTIEGKTTEQQELMLNEKDRQLVKPYDTLLARGVAGYKKDGSTKTPSKPLMLFCVEKASSGNPVVRAINGVKSSQSNVNSCLVTIPEGTELSLLGNALYETQKWVQPSSMHPVTKKVYLQKRGMTHIVSDYFDSQKKRIEFKDALIAEEEIRRFKLRGNRTLWAGIPGHITVDVKDTGQEDIYTTEGIRYQFLRELQHTGKWTFEQFIGLTKMFKTGVDVPKGDGLVICGNNLLESIQCIDFSKHPEVQISTERNPFGWEVTKIHTVFCNLQFKHDPTLDRLGYSNSGALLAENRLVHYERTSEHGYSEKMEDHEATRSSTLVYDALVLKGACHIWIDGESDGTEIPTDAVTYVLHNEATAPSAPVKGTVYYLLCNCPAINKNAKEGQFWKYNGTGYEHYSGEINAKPTV